MKTAWKYLDGWKTVIVALVLMAEQLSAGTAYEGPLGYVRAVANAIGWQSVLPAFDPGATLAAISTLIAVGHKVLKAGAQVRAGVSVADLRP